MLKQKAFFILAFKIFITEKVRNSSMLFNSYLSYTGVKCHTIIDIELDIDT